MRVEPLQVQQWLGFLAELRQWNRSYNLVAPGAVNVLVPRHLLDSLSVCAHLASGSVLDVGTGAGFPGLALAIARPEQPFCLLDSNGKKARFVRHVVRKLALDNVEVVQQRVEHYSAETAFSTIVCRAFSSLPSFVCAVRHLAGPQTRLLAMKGKLPQQELDSLPGWVEVQSRQALPAGDAGAQRELVVLGLKQPL